MKSVLDTNFLIWIVLGSERLDEYRWLERDRPWGVSPVSFLELEFLGEAGKLEVRFPDFMDAVMRDPRFVVDEIPLLTLIRHSLELRWTKDPFDRLLAAHSAARRVPLCTADRLLLRHHAPLPREVR
ncbi:MAG: PIN domain-containing protein [Gemmatimonadetes bacterium]|nr:PIN domain-containing protein [Gemmatimonadota bacterium]